MLDQAEAALRYVIKVHTATKGEGDLETVVAISRLAGLLYDREEYDEALRLYRHVLEAKRSIFGHESATALHPCVVLTMGHLALACKAVACMKHSEALRLDALHSHTFQKSDREASVAMEEEARGLIKEAEDYLIRCRHANSDLLGSNHPRALLSLSHLQQLYHEQGRLVELTPLLREEVSMHREERGYKDVGTIAASGALGADAEGGGEICH